MRLIFLFLLYLFSLTVFAANNQISLNHESVRWSKLVYEASAFFVTMQTDVTLNMLNRQDALAQLAMQEETNLNFPKGENVFRVETFAEGFGKKTRYSLWFDNNGEILQRKKVQRGKKNEIKIYRFSPCAYYYIRKKFPNKKFDEEYSHWDVSSWKFFEFQPEQCGDEPIYDANALLYIISTLNISQAGFERDVLTFSKGKLFRVKIKARRKTSIYSEFKLKTPEGLEEIEDAIDVLKIQLSPMVANAKEAEDFRFLGLKGTINIYLDTKRQLIVRLSGKVDVVGTLDINLKKAELER